MQANVYVSVDAPSGERLIVDGNLALLRELVTALELRPAREPARELAQSTKPRAVKTSQVKGVKGHD